MSRGIKKSLIALSISGVLTAPSAFATNGYFSHGYSTAEKGLAGAGVAYSHDSLASATNPAGLVKVGERMDVGAAIFNPNRQYTASNPSGDATIGTSGFPAFPLTPGTYESSHDYFLIPHFGYNWMLDSTSAFGIAAYGNGGMNTDYQTVTNPAPFPPGTYSGGNAGIDLKQLFINASYSKQIDDKNALGASLIMAYQTFKATGLGAFGPNPNTGSPGFSTDPTKLTDNGDDTSMGFGVKLGWQGDVTNDLSVGVSYQSKMSMSEFDDYAGLFAEKGGFDIPASAIIGLAWKTSDRSTLVVDIQQIYYSDVPSIGNDGLNNLFACGGASLTTGDSLAPTCLGGSSGAGFAYDDMTVIKIGYEWRQNDMTWRVGVSDGDQPVSDKETMLNILAPAVIDTHLTFGFTMPIDSASEFTFAGMYGLSNSVKGPTGFDNTQTVELEMDQFELQGTYTMKF